MSAYRTCGNCDVPVALDFRDATGDLDGEVLVCWERDLAVDPDGPACDVWEEGGR